MKIGDTDIKMKEDVQDGIHLQTIMHRTKNSSPIWIEDHGTHSSSLLGIMQKQVDFIKPCPFFLRCSIQLWNIPCN